MKKLFCIAALLVAMLLPVSAEAQTMASVCKAGNDVTVTWTGDASDANGIETLQLLRGTDSTMSDAVPVKDVPVNATLAVDESVPDGSYYYRIRAIDPCGNSGDSTVSNNVIVDTTDPVWSDGEVHAG